MHVLFQEFCIYSKSVCKTPIFFISNKIIKNYKKNPTFFHYLKMGTFLFRNMNLIHFVSKTILTIQNHYENIGEFTITYEL